MTPPEFPQELEWLNTNRPLRLRELRGKVVLLDFWTYCCIDCMHIIPDLKRLEHKYADELVVIGVHSAKFTTERESDNLRRAIARYEIVHPVVNDRDLVVWQEYGARAWPTLVLIDPAGKIAHTRSGGKVFEAFDGLVAGLVRQFDAAGELDRRPLDLGPVEHAPASPLAFPGKVLADAASRRLFIADSNHNRVVVVSLTDNSVVDIIGRGEVGLQDGNFESATFNHPQGMALVGDILYIADTENHALRAADLAARTVTTAAGTGQQPGSRAVGGLARETPLNSPWDLVEQGGALYIAMAGPHQIWKLDLATGEIHPYAGAGREARVDGPLAQAALAQPSGITTDGKKLYFADSEVSCVRSADLDPNGEVATIAGGDLFDYGDRDAVGRLARFQHPLGIVYHAGVLYVADTYNNKIKRVSPADRSVATFLGAGQRGLQDGAGEQAAFYEPGGVSIARGKLYIADTNNHLVRGADLATGRVETLQITGLRPPTMGAKPAGERLALPAQTVAPGEARLTISLILPAGHKLNEQAPTTVKLRSSQTEVIAFDGRADRIIGRPTFPLNVPLQLNPGEAELNLDLLIYYCGADVESLCYFREARLTLPVKVEKGSANHQLQVSYAVPAA